MVAKGTPSWYESQCNADLERELCRRDVGLFTIYFNMKIELRDNYYSYIDYECPWFTDHGIKHCEQILKFASDMLSKNLVFVNNMRRKPIETRLSDQDIFVLLSAIIWHDIGMLLGRDDHGTNITNFVISINKFVNDEELSKSITHVAAAHTSNNYFNICKIMNKFNLPDNTVAIVQEKLLAAVLRLSDEVSENKHRVTTLESVIKKIPPDQLVFWQHAKAINLSYYDITDDSISIGYKIPSDMVFKKFKVVEKDGTLSKVDFYNFITSRICKVYRELELCNPFFKDFISVSKYHVEIVFVHKTLATGVIKESTPIEKNIDFLGYSKNSPDTLQNFYTYYPEFDPKKIGDVVKNFLAGV